VWHNQYRLDRTLASVRWQAETLGRRLGIPVAQGVAIVPTTLLRLALGDEQLLSEVAVELYAATARIRLRPVSSAWRRRFFPGSSSRSSGD
jgi:hypothetical protein